MTGRPRIAVLAPKGASAPLKGLDSTIAIVEYTGAPWSPDPDPCTLDLPGIIIAPPAYKPRGDCKGKIVTVFPSLQAVKDSLDALGAEEILRDPEAALYKTTAILALSYREHKRSLIGSGMIPSRPPPVMVAADYYPGDVNGALRLYTEGADIVVVSASRRGWRSIVEKLVDSGVPTGVDAGLDASVASEAADMGAMLVMSLTHGTLDEIPARLRGRPWWVLIPSRLDPDPGERARRLLSTASEASRLGYKKLLLDPVAQPLVEPGFLTPLYAARLLAGTSYPVMLGLNNVYEMADADTTGSIPVLVSLAFEAGASVVLASEESTKARGAVLEAASASFMVYLASRWRTTIKNLGVRLLLAKEKRNPEHL